MGFSFQGKWVMRQQVLKAKESVLLGHEPGSHGGLTRMCITPVLI
jgi:hypothetical protein